MKDSPYLSGSFQSNGGRQKEVKSVSRWEHDADDGGVEIKQSHWWQMKRWLAFWAPYERGSLIRQAEATQDINEVSL